jgi:hypothetical protein
MAERATNREAITFAWGMMAGMNLLTENQAPPDYQNRSKLTNRVGNLRAILKNLGISPTWTFVWR